MFQDYSAREWVKQGAPKEKLMIGMPTYGRSFSLVDSTKFDIGAPASGGGSSGKYTAEAGFMSYYEVCDFLHEDNTTLVWDNEQQVPFAYRDNQWVGFDDERSLKTKVCMDSRCKKRLFLETMFHFLKFCNIFCANFVWL